MTFPFRENVTDSQLWGFGVFSFGFGLVFFNLLPLLGGFDWGFFCWFFFGWGNAGVWAMYFVGTVGTFKVDISFMNNEV